MPGMNGIEAARAIHRADAIVGIVILSVHDEPAYIQAAFDAGARGYVLKLAAESELIPAIEAVSADHFCVSTDLR